MAKMTNTQAEAAGREAAKPYKLQGMTPAEIDEMAAVPRADRLQKIEALACERVPQDLPNDLKKVWLVGFCPRHRESAKGSE